MMPTVVIQVKVRPNAGVSELTESEGTWLARLKARPTEGKANDELIALVARHFGTPRSAVRIKRGATSRIKVLSIDRD
jgi:uncharacterized protein (TIGR00251 family)